MQYGVTDFITHLVYIARWVVLAVPGAWVLQWVRGMLARRSRRAGQEERKGQEGREERDNIVVAMLISQGVLGALVFFVDRLIFK